MAIKIGKWNFESILVVSGLSACLLWGISLITLFVVNRNHYKRKPRGTVMELNPFANARRNLGASEQENIYDSAQ